MADLVAASDGFPPIEARDAHTLVLGSLPGKRSIAEQQYYAHPQNAFWPIMKALFGIDGGYAQRCERLCQRGIAVWDVLASSVRPGSMDANIDVGSAVVNDFESFLAEHERLQLIAFNGKKAEQLFRRFVDLGPLASRIELRALPSTSPAYAAMPLSGKLAAWRDVLISRQ